MIQRVQSVFLLLTFALLLALFFVPMAYFLSDGEQFVLTAWGIRTLTDPGMSILSTTHMGVLLILSTALPLVNIFLYRKRWLQIRLCIVEIVLLLGLQIFMIYYILGTRGAVSSALIHSVRYSVVDVIPLVGIILSILAFRGVVKDETLVKSLERIR